MVQNSVLKARMRASLWSEKPPICYFECICFDSIFICTQLQAPSSDANVFTLSTNSKSDPRNHAEPSLPQTTTSFRIRIPILKQVWNDGLWNGDSESQRQNVLGNIKILRRLTTSAWIRLPGRLVPRWSTTTILNQTASTNWYHNDQKLRFWIRAPKVSKMNSCKKVLKDGQPEPCQINDSKTNAEHQFIWRFWIEKRPKPELPSQEKQHMSASSHGDLPFRFWIRMSNLLRRPFPTTNWIILRRFWHDRCPTLRTQNPSQNRFRIATVSPWNRQWNLIFGLVDCRFMTDDWFWISHPQNGDSESQQETALGKNWISKGGSPLRFWTRLPGRLRFWIRLPGRLTILNQSGPMMINNHDSESNRQCQLVPRWSRTTIPNRNCHC